MIIVSTEQRALLLSLSPVFIAEENSNTPHSACIDGQIEQLMDPPTLPARATEKGVIFD